MEKIAITVYGWRCLRCGHEWVPRGEELPKVCASCNSPYWDRPRKQIDGYKT